MNEQPGLPVTTSILILQAVSQRANPHIQHGWEPVLQLLDCKRTWETRCAGENQHIRSANPVCFFSPCSQCYSYIRSLPPDQILTSNSHDVRQTKMEPPHPSIVICQDFDNVRCLFFHQSPAGARTGHCQVPLGSHP